MKNRRDWERFIRRRPDTDLDQPSEFVSWVSSRIPENADILDLGAGLAHNALAFARAGHSVVAADYARFTFRRATEQARSEGLDVKFINLNLRSLRNTLSGLARIVRWQPGPRVLFCSGLIESLDSAARLNLRQLLKYYGRPGDQIFLEFSPGSPAKHDPWQGGARVRVEIADVHAWLREAGAVIEESATGGIAIDGRPTHRIRARCGTARTESRSAS